MVTPKSDTTVAILISGVGIWKLRRFRTKLQQLKPGHDGEEAPNRGSSIYAF